MRHRKAGNRINMPEPRRRAAFRSLIEGLIRYEHVTTTEARAKAIKAEAERLITIALNGHKRALAHIREVVEDDALVLPLWELAGEANFSLTTEIPTNEERASAKRYPVREEVLQQKRTDLEDRKKRLRQLIRDDEKASAGLQAAREGRVMELHARRTILKHLPSKIAVSKLFDPAFFQRFEHRAGGYTRLTRVGRRVGDGSEMVRWELIQEA